MRMQFGKEAISFLNWKCLRNCFGSWSESFSDLDASLDVYWFTDSLGLIRIFGLHVFQYTLYITVDRLFEPGWKLGFHTGK